MRQHFYKPMLAKVAEKPFSDKNWIFEIKWDGFRAVAYVEEPFSLKSRNSKELKFNFPELHQLADLANNVVIDGEIVIMQNGKPDFQRLLERGQAMLAGEIKRQAQLNPAIYVIFDILEKDGKSLTDLTLMQRKAILKDSIKEGDNVILSDFIEEKGEAYYQSALDKGLEGVVAKRKDSRYEEGIRSANWLKMKEIKSCDCVIFGYTEGTKSRKATFGALLLGVYDKEKKPIYVGKVGTGFTEKILKSLFEMVKKLKTNFAPFSPEAGDKVTWIEPELVCEVDYQVLTRDMRLRMARFKRLRDDKSPKECTIDQLIKTEELGKAIAEDKLSEYKLKRRFQETPEPEGGQKKGARLIYIIQEHHARRLHYDLRLEKDGVLKSWAVPKGIPEAGQKVLAVETEDHPYDYASFEGEIPKGQYGAGTVKIWDKGYYEAKVWENDKVEFTLDGDRLKGRYILVKLKRASEKDWLLLKGKT